MLETLKQQLKGKYPDGCAKELEAAEKLFELQEFTSDMALKLGTHILEVSKKYGEDVVIQIVRERDQAVVFQYIGDTKTEKNIMYAQMKRNTVLKTGHCSLWAMAQAQTEGGWEELFQDESKCLPVGGAFPVYINGIHEFSICVSGLHEGKDHSLIVESLAGYFGKELPVFHGQYI